MNGLSRILPLLLCLVALSASAAVFTNSVVVTPEPPLQIVTCRDDADVDALLNEHQVKLKNPNHHLRASKMFFAPLDKGMIQRLKHDPRVLAVEEDGPVSLCGQTNSTGIVRVGAPQFPVARINGTNEPLDVDVAVLDSGIDPHPDLNVFKFYSPFTETPNDELQHGTGVAGIIGALDNDTGVVGVAPGVRLWNIKIFDPDHNNWSDILSGMNYCFQNSNQISVANMSFVNEGATAPFLSLRSAVRRMVDAGIVVVAAAGNNARDIAGPDGVFATSGNSTDDSVPAALPEVMAVSAINPTNDTFWIETMGSLGSNFSQVPRTNATNYVFSLGGAIDVAAPGFGIRALYTNGTYATFKGTSMAAPHVAGLVALYIAANGRATNAAGVYAIRQAIVNASLPQSQWNTNNTHDPDTNPEPLAIASEAWVPKPAFTNTTGGPGNFQVRFAAVPGYSYTVQSSTNLALPSAWTNQTTIIGSNFVVTATVTDTNAAPQKFYRLKRTASP
jgi:subtilisin family serine protease